MSLIEELEAFIRSGQFDEVERRLANLGKIERKEAVVFANIARRVKRLNLAAKILNPIVRPTDQLQAPATAQEKMEYADTLRQLGAVAEARELLSEVDTQAFPQALAYQGFCMMSEWRYQEAFEFLNQYVQHKDVAAYDRTVAQINIAASLIYIGKLQEAEELLKQLREETLSANLRLLYGNSLELSAQMMILKGDFDAGLIYLNESAEILKSAAKVVSLFVEKWTAIARSLKAGQVTSELQEIFIKAQAARHWETIRDCDLYLAYLRKDVEQFRLVYFGTPYDSFRQRILGFAGATFEIPNEYLWSPFPDPKFILNLVTGEVTGGRTISLPAGQSLHRLFILLAQDFYKPLSVMSAFGKIFPDEYMNAVTSANRVHQIIKRCREWIEESNLPMQIDEADGTYKLLLKEGMGIRVPSTPIPMSKEEVELLILEKYFGARTFKAHQVEDVFSRSSSVNRLLLRWGVEKGRIQKFGEKKGTTYQMVLSSKPAKAG